MLPSIFSRLDALLPDGLDDDFRPMIAVPRASLAPAINRSPADVLLTGCVVPLVMLIGSPLLVIYGLAILTFDIFSLCGLPCPEGRVGNCAALPATCLCCYTHRRLMVRRLNLTESAAQSRCIVLWCCLCSELQVWRELRNNGVWPGLLGCDASAEDRAAISEAAVRARFGVAACDVPAMGGISTAPPMAFGMA